MRKIILLALEPPEFLHDQRQNPGNRGILQRGVRRNKRTATGTV
jgi:hypothetical protein